MCHKIDCKAKTEALFKLNVAVFLSFFCLDTVGDVGGRLTNAK